jgi:glyoxylase-like metal-dependent hydrolase (beta-lactamase superfamily II)
MRILIVNVFFVGERNGPWVLVDAGLPFSANRIRQAAASRYGESSRPEAIILTHGHFDHVGALRELAREWDVPVYAHRLEMPYITGRSKYPPPDPTVGGGLMASMAPLYPRGPVDVSERVETLPEDGSVPKMPGWRWIHTPGHTAGHVSFFRDSDRVLIAGDAFITTKQESLTAVMMQRPEFHGPPAYYTSDWDAARRSVERLAELNPSIVACGHGLPVDGDEAARGLRELARNFDEVARPSRGRYAQIPAVTNEQGIVSLPPPVVNKQAWTVGLLAAGLLAGYAATKVATRSRE